MSMPPNSGKYAYCAASHADGRSIPAHRQRRQPETRRLPAIGWSACGGKPETVRSKGFSNGVYLRIRESDVEEFKRTFRSTTDTLVSQSDLFANERCEFLVPDLAEVWDFCRKYPRLRSIADVGQGLTYRSFNRFGFNSPKLASFLIHKV